MARDVLNLSDLLGMGGAAAVLLGFGAAAGWWLDHLLHTSPLMIVLGIALGLAGGVCYIIIQIRSVLKE
jgi:F0F1-type ATP synthase assembly protein I